MNILLPITIFLIGGILSVFFMLLFIHIIERPSSEETKEKSHLIEITQALTELTKKIEKSPCRLQPEMNLILINIRSQGGFQIVRSKGV